MPDLFILTSWLKSDFKIFHNDMKIQINGIFQSNFPNRTYVIFEINNLNVFGLSFSVEII